MHYAALCLWTWSQMQLTDIGIPTLAARVMEVRAWQGPAKIIVCAHTCVCPTSVSQLGQDDGQTEALRVHVVLGRWSPRFTEKADGGAMMAVSYSEWRIVALLMLYLCLGSGPNSSRGSMSNVCRYRLATCVRTGEHALHRQVKALCDAVCTQTQMTFLKGLASFL